MVGSGHSSVQDFPVRWGMFKVR